MSEKRTLWEVLIIVGLSLLAIGVAWSVKDIDENVSKIAAALEAQSARKE